MIAGPTEARQSQETMGSTLHSLLRDNKGNARDVGVGRLFPEELAGIALAEGR